MVDTSWTKNKLNQVVSTLEAVYKERIDNLNNLIYQTALELTNTLDDNNLFIDSMVLEKLKSVRDHIERPTLVAAINAEWAAVPAWDAKKPLYDQFNIVGGTKQNKIEERYQEYNNMCTLAERFNLDANLSNTTCVLWAWAPVNLDLASMTTWINIPYYSLCDEHWKPLTTWVVWGDTYYEMNINWRRVKVFWIAVNRATKNISFTNVRVDPADADISSPIKLSVNARFNPTRPRISSVNIISNKPFELKINASIALDSGTRENRIDLYNAWWSLAWTLHVVNDHLLNTFRDHEGKLLRDAIATAVTRTWSPIFDTLTPEQKEDFYKRMLDPASAMPWLLGEPVRNAFWEDKHKLASRLWSFVDYDEFKRWFAHNDRAWNKDPNITKDPTYTQYIHDHYREEVTNYLKSRLDDFLKVPANETFLKAQVANYLVEIDNNKKDEDVIRDVVDNDLDNTEARMERKPWTRYFENKDCNFMRFFSWSHKEIKNQSVNLSTTTSADPVEKWPINYDMSLSVWENNKLEVELTIGWKKLEPISSWDWDPATLAQRILREPSIEYNKVRVHIVYNLYRGLLELAKEKNMKLEYYNATTDRMMELWLDSNWNIILNSVNYHTTPPFDKDTDTLFDFQWFQNTNQFNDISRHNSLQEGVNHLSRHFSYAMNRLHDGYRRSTKRSIWKRMGITSSLWLPTSIWTSPIRKILNSGNSLNFDFNTRVWDTQIDLKWNTFTITNPKLKEPLVTKDLWKILNKRVDKVRIFDWQERDIVEAIYSNLIKKLRENTKIRRTNFWVVDDVTGHLYILDDNGHFWRINRDALNGRSIIHWGGNIGVINPNLLRGRTWAPLGGWIWWRFRRLIHWTASTWYVYHRLSADEEKEIMKNPLIMQWFVKAMNKRMGIVESVRAWFTRH